MKENEESRPLTKPTRETHQSLYAFDLSSHLAAGEVGGVPPASRGTRARRTIPSPRGLAWTTGATHLIVGTKNELLLLNPSTLAIDKRWGPLGVGQVFYPTASSDGKWIFAPAVSMALCW
jgi:hypothetical protein